MTDASTTTATAPAEERKGMLITKANEQDMETAFELCALMDAISRGSHPFLGETQPDDLPDYFDEEDPKHLRALYRMVHTLAEAAGGGLWRIIGGMDSVLRSGIFDPDKDHLSLHPDIMAGQKLLAAQRDSEATPT